MFEYPMSFSLRQLRYFHAAAESGRISRAAIELNITQSAVTTAIRQLEEALGTTLLKRSASGVTLTPAGERFLRHAREILTSVAEAMHIEPQSAETVGQVRVGVTYTIFGYFLAPLLARFRQLYPGVTLQFQEARRRVIEGSIAKGKCDLALVIVQGEEAPRQRDIHVKTLYRSARRLWLPARHRLIEAETVSLEQLVDEPYIALTIDDAWENAKDYWKHIRGGRPNVVMKTSSIEGVRTMVGMGLGVTILSDMLYRPWSIERHRIETRDLALPIPVLKVSMLIPVRRPLDQAARAFATFLQRASNTGS
ncbi:MAG: LysR family transcriptional regulator [Gammaproteobacteria bacterium]|nr:LysR family transcriptional regulator [Gammaproteobacteria bacterium]